MEGRPNPLTMRRALGMEPMPMAACKWHWMRRAQMLRDHPEIKALHGSEPLSAAVVVVMVFFHVLLACNVHRLPFLGLLLAAGTLGAWFTFGFQALVHEMTHSEKKTWHRTLVIRLASGCCNFPWSMYYEDYHPRFVRRKQEEGKQEEQEKKNRARRPP